MTTDGLSLLKTLYERAESDISESEARIREAAKFRDRLAEILGDPMASYLSQVSLPTAHSVVQEQAGEISQSGDGYFREMKMLLSALRTARGHMPKIYLLVEAGGGKINLTEAAEFLLSERFSEAKNVETLVKNIGTSINKDPNFVQDQSNKRVYYFLPMRQPAIQPEASPIPDVMDSDSGNPSTEDSSDEHDLCSDALVLQRQFTEECSETPGERRGVWRESGWPDGCATAPPPATAATPQHPTAPGAASRAPHGTPAAC